MKTAQRAILLTLLLAGCLGGEPRKPTRPEGAERARAQDEEPSPRRPAERDPFSIEAHLPRSGDPARPNVKVELTVVDVRSGRDLWLRGAVQGTVVRGVVRARAALSAGSRSGRARSRSSSFLVVQAGRSASLQLTDTTRALIGPYAGLWVHVARAGADGAEVALEPYVSPTSVPGEQLAGATTVFVRPGEALVLGGFSQSHDSERGGWLGHEERSGSRELIALLTVDVLR